MASTGALFRHTIRYRQSSLELHVVAAIDDDQRIGRNVIRDVIARRHIENQNTRRVAAKFDHSGSRRQIACLLPIRSA